MRVRLEVLQHSPGVGAETALAGKAEMGMVVGVDFALTDVGGERPLSEEERIKVREQLTDIAKSIPALAIFALPGGGILLPILIKVLPFNILPSAFSDDPPKA